MSHPQQNLTNEEKKDDSVLDPVPNMMDSCEPAKETDEFAQLNQEAGFEKDAIEHEKKQVLKAKLFDMLEDTVSDVSLMEGPPTVDEI